jgi:N-sulfoglucosamine sulfohydrolase
MKRAELLMFPLIGCALNAVAAEKPNVLFIIADDASRHFSDAYGCSWIKTPNIDRLSKSGLVFENAYTPTAKCSPCRAAILTGRNPWQLEEAADHAGLFPLKFKAFSEVLLESGICVGGEGKVWAPGVALTADGKKRTFGFGLTGKADKVRFFEGFLKAQPADKPFFYWFGSSYPHRPYTPDCGLAAGKKPEEIDRVPGIWPDHEAVRRDMLDYAVQVEAFDQQVGELMRLLEADGRASNTLVIVTSDNGMPFPRTKGHEYDISNILPLVAYWPNGIVHSGRRVKDFVSFIDFAPTFLELLGVDGVKGGMFPITGRSFTDLLCDKPERVRDFVIMGRERNDYCARPGTPSGLGYPIRSIRKGNLFYNRNFEPDRWPCGNPELGLQDTDKGPAKKFIEGLGEQSLFWQNAFGKRPAEELFDLSNDPDCLNNLAGKPEFKKPLAALRKQLTEELIKQNDPRILGQGAVFDHYLAPKWTSTGSVEIVIWKD